jgi:hypothetical protein
VRVELEVEQPVPGESPPSYSRRDGGDDGG